MANNPRPVDYQMSKKLFDGILSTRKSETDKKQNPYQYVMNVLNQEYGIRGTIKHISVGVV